MRRLCGFITGTVLMTVLWSGCGSTSNNDQLVMQFISFDNTGIIQEDSVGETSAVVDNVQEKPCSGTQDNELFTDTLINAVFLNNEASDITLDHVVIDVGPTSGSVVPPHAIGRTLPGGLCSNIFGHCASDADCLSVSGACGHSDTAVSDILLFSTDEKTRIRSGTYPVNITFFGFDANRSFQTSTVYSVTFTDLQNCTTTGGGVTPTAPLGSTPTATRTPTAMSTPTA